MSDRDQKSVKNRLITGSFSLFPACAGVIPRWWTTLTQTFTFPRVCRGDPMAQQTCGITNAFSHATPFCYSTKNLSDTPRAGVIRQIFSITHASHKYRFRSTWHASFSSMPSRHRSSACSSQPGTNLPA